VVLHFGAEGIERWAIQLEALANVDLHIPNSVFAG
jgi:hypothetical protein